MGGGSGLDGRGVDLVLTGSLGGHACCAPIADLTCAASFLH